MYFFIIVTELICLLLIKNVIKLINKHDLQQFNEFNQLETILKRQLCFKSKLKKTFIKSCILH